jgi:O-methyltransferase
MANQVETTSDLLSYVREVSLRDDQILRDLRKETTALPGGNAMQVMAEEGQFLALLVRLTGANRVLEIGTYTGYSTLCMARALPPDGRIVTCDISEKWPMIAAEFWQRAEVEDRIELLVGDAADVISALIDGQGPATFDLVFIDADKANYVAYYEGALTLVRQGGLIVLDNTLFFGRVIDPDAQDADTVAVRTLNQLLRDDERVEISLLPVADGVTLARKR